MDEIHPPTKVIGGDRAGDRFLAQTKVFVIYWADAT